MKRINLKINAPLSSGIVSLAVAVSYGSVINILTLCEYKERLTFFLRAGAEWTKDLAPNHFAIHRRYGYKTADAKKKIRADQTH
jgi:hypothetical protein